MLPAFGLGSAAAEYSQRGKPGGKATGAFRENSVDSHRLANGMAVFCVAVWATDIVKIFDPKAGVSWNLGQAPSLKYKLPATCATA